MANINLLKGRIVAAGLTLNEFASKIKMPYTTFSRRMKSRIFGSDEIERISKVLNLTAEEIQTIFFN
ncbi:MAG: helix-turn-helix domain-containing protein [Bilifractor sp.]